jgi:hypothetical protein
MKPTDLFGVIVRTIGMLLLINGVWYLVYGLLEGAGAIPESQPEGATLYFASGLPFLIGGCFMMRGAEWLVRFCYPTTDAPANDSHILPNSD